MGKKSKERRGHSKERHRHSKEKHKHSREKHRHSHEKHSGSREHSKECRPRDSSEESEDDDDAPSQTVDAGTEQPAALETPLKTARSHRKKTQTISPESTLKSDPLLQ